MQAGQGIAVAPNYSAGEPPGREWGCRGHRVVAIVM